jgi:hypothetical protein
MSKLVQQIAVLLVVVLAINGAWQFAAADAEPKKGRLKWEWSSLNKTNARAQDPAEGWELVAVDQGVLYFKRPKSD